MWVRIAPSTIKKQLFLFESFYPEIYAEIFFTKIRHTKGKTSQFFKIQLHVKTNVTLAAGVAPQD